MIDTGKSWVEAELVAVASKDRTFDCSYRCDTRKYGMTGMGQCL